MASKQGLHLTTHYYQAVQLILSPRAPGLKPAVRAALGLFQGASPDAAAALRCLPAKGCEAARRMLSAFVEAGPTAAAAAAAAAAGAAGAAGVEVEVKVAEAVEAEEESGARVAEAARAALRAMPRRTLLLHLNAVQSLAFNRAATRRMELAAGEGVVTAAGGGGGGAAAGGGAAGGGAAGGVPVAGLSPMAGDLVWASTWRERYAAAAADADSNPAGVVAAAAAAAAATVESAPADAMAAERAAGAASAAAAESAECAEGAEGAEGEGGRAWAPAALPPAVHVLSAGDVTAGLFGAPSPSPIPSLTPGPA